MRVRSSLVIGLSMLIASVSLWSCRVMAKARRRPRRTHPLTRPEQNKSAHDRLDLFDAPRPCPPPRHSRINPTRVRSSVSISTATP